MAWMRSQRREAGYDDSVWGIRHSREYWLGFLKLGAVNYPALEVGCGDSGLWRFDAGVHGLDPLNYSHLGRNFTCGKAEALPFPDKAFRDVICVNALDHCEDPAKAVAEMRRVGQRLVLWSYVFPHESYQRLYSPHPYALTVGWISRALEGMNITCWCYVSPWEAFSGTSTLAGKAKLLAAEWLGVRALLIHVEEKA